MIIVRRSPSNVNKLQNILSLSTSSSPMASPLLPSSSSSSGSSSGGSSGSSTTSSSSSSCGGGQSQPFDWAYALSPENKSKAIQLLTMDKENSNNNFRKVMTTTTPEGEEVMLRKAAVLIPLCYDVNGKPSLLYNLRSLSMNKHRGEISFPGGSLDPEDKGSEIVAALRETHEEVGIHPSSIDVWTSLRMFPTIATDLVVIPVIGLIKDMVDPAKLTINPDEVDHAFTITLEHLCDPQNWEDGPKRKVQGLAFHMPMWKNLKVYSGGNGGCGDGAEEIHLWGLTAFVTHIALLSLLPKNVYERKLPYLQLQLKKLKGSPKL